MASFEVIVECPEHKKPVYLVIEASRSDEAVTKALDMVVPCPFEPTHNFVVGLRRGREEIAGVTMLPWTPLPEETISVAPSLTPIKPVPPTPLEKVYYVDPQVAQRQLRKLRWWERE